VPSAVLLAELIDALAEDDIEPVRAWLRVELVESGRLPARYFDDLAYLARWNAEANLPDLGTGVSPQDRATKTAETIRQALRAAAGVPAAAPLLALYLKYECEQAWEVSWDHRPIRLVIRSAGEAWRAVTTAVADAVLTAAALDSLEIVDHEMAVETAAGCATLRAYALAARRTADFAARVRATATACAPSPVSAHIAATGEREWRYYDAVALAAQAAYERLTGGAGAGGGGADGGGADGGGELDRAIGALAEVETHELIDEIDRSELRAHRFSLEALRDAADRPWVHVDHAKIVYLYPFGIRGATAPHLVDALRDHGRSWTVAGMPVVDLRKQLLLNDIWKGDDPLERRYEGAALHLPDLAVPDPDRADGAAGGDPDEEPALTMNVELRLSEMGNHCLRIEYDLTDAGPQDLFTAMLRAAPEFGDLAELGHPIRSGETEWPRLADYATEVIGEVVNRLRTHLGPDIQLSARPGLYHVLVSIDRVSTRSGSHGPAQPLTGAQPLVDLFGAEPLRHPVRHGVSAIAEWARYPTASVVVEVPDFVGDLILRTGNTTVVAILGSPGYMVGAVEEAAEFVASLDGLFAGWQDELADYYKNVQPELVRMVDRLRHRTVPGVPPRVPISHEDTVEELLDRQEAFERQQLRLHAFVMSSQSTLIFITSPSLVTSPVVRLTLDRLLAAAGFEHARAEFVGTVEGVLGDRLGALIAALVRRRQESEAEAAQVRREEAEALAQAAERRAQEHERKQRRRTELILAFVAGIGFSGVAQILQSGYDLKQAAAIALAVLVVAVAIVVGLSARVRETIVDRDPPSPAHRRGGSARERKGAP
jgi:hypothetical protein